MAHVEGAVTEPTTVGEHAQELAMKVASMAAETAERATGVLGPILDQTVTEAPSDTKGGLAVTWPPYFDDLRKTLVRIERALDSINDTLNRVAL